MKTALYEQHLADGARIVDFAGWQMPLHYGSQIREHEAVRTNAGRFDVSHMGVVDIYGDQSVPFLRRLFVSDVGRLTESGMAQYTLMATSDGGIIDDLIVYRLEDRFRIVVNAARRQVDLQWMQRNAEDFAVDIVEEKTACIIAVQGPSALNATERALGASSLAEVPSFRCVLQNGLLIARTGYTGENGVEIICDADDAVEVWNSLGSCGVVPAGLGARDSLRLEAGLNLYGQDMDQSTSPLVSNLSWTIHLSPDDRDFVGRQSIVDEKNAGPAEKLAGLVLTERGVIRRGQNVETNSGPGIVTSGTFSPTLRYSIALARLPRAATGQCTVEIRGRHVGARIVRPPFVRYGKRVHS